MINSGRLTGEIKKFVEQPLRLRLRKSGNGMSVTANGQGLAPGFGMGLFQRAQRRPFLIEAMAKILSVFLNLRHKARLQLAVYERMMGRETFDPAAHLRG